MEVASTGARTPLTPAKCPQLKRFGVLLRHSELGTPASRAALMYSSRRWNLLLGPGGAAALPPAGEALVPACQVFAFRQEELPEVTLAASEAKKELVSTKGTPPAFALPVKVLSFWRGSVVLAEQSLARRSLAVRGG